ncbi:Uncharacterized protein dnm_021260 [Desulfonema magnum]|uniref:Uncharacterized protein n=1 Tax=Desulfonema magnum TaxID=45655 RepID=A0A975BIS6_9BACT|nr:Uncharacterized protein dnm_021260 [Desulfonema magnum]
MFFSMSGKETRLFSFRRRNSFREKSRVSSPGNHRKTYD